MCLFLKSIDVWHIVETGWIKPEATTAELSVAQNSARLSNEKALHALCQALSPSEFKRISNYKSAKKAWQILETTYEGTKLVKSAKLQMLISRFEEIKMLENETFGEFYTRINELRNSIVSLGKKAFVAKLRSLSELFRIKVTSIEESKDLDFMKIEELVWSLQTYEYFLPPVKKAKGMAFKATKSKVSSDEDSDNEDELAMIANMINKLMKTDKFIEGLSETPSEADPEQDPRGQRCCECFGFGHMKTECANLKQAKKKVYIVTLSDESEKEKESPKNCLASVAPHEDQDDLHYSEHGDEKLKEEYCILYMEILKLRESNQKKMIKLNTMKTERDTLLQKITDLKDKLMDAQLQLEKFSSNKIHYKNWSNLWPMFSGDWGCLKWH
jgi:hypothetical protein